MIPVILFSFAFTMAKSHVLFSWNVRGLSTVVKWLAVMHTSKQVGSSIICLQETHLSHDHSSPFSTRLFPYQFHSTYSSYTRGVSTLVSGTTSFSCIISFVDPHGCYNFLLCKLEGLECVIVNIYIPLPFSVEALKIFANFLAHHPNTPAIVVGNSNNLLDVEMENILLPPKINRLLEWSLLLPDFWQRWGYGVFGALETHRPRHCLVTQPHIEASGG